MYHSGIHFIYEKNWLYISLIELDEKKTSQWLDIQRWSHEKSCLVNYYYKNSIEIHVYIYRFVFV